MVLQRATQAAISSKYRNYVENHPDVYPEDSFYLKVLDTWPVKAVRANTHCVSIEELCSRWNIPFKPVPWCNDASYFEFENKIGKTSQHNDGLCYISDPSSMAVVPLLNIQPDDCVIDMCAAPGGKSTHALNYLGPSGILILNEIDSRRIRTLRENIDRLIKPIPQDKRPQVVIESMTIPSFVEHYKNMGDIVILDAPCSGEAMMRRSNTARHQWSEKLVNKMSILQKQLLFHATQLLDAEGKIGYSTCTFNKNENDEVVEFGITQLDLYDNDISSLSGIPGVLQRSVGVVLFPHKVRGDGQYVAVLSRESISK